MSVGAAAWGHARRLFHAAVKRNGHVMLKILKWFGVAVFVVAVILAAIFVFVMIAIIQHGGA